jgi:bifunctional DNA-binding transcriptional regulator/antitoxin component of YhaV-PrlF toxin-antitoxin module
MEHCITFCGEVAMTTLKVTTRGQVTFRKDVLNHLGVRAGGKIRLDLLPDGRAELQAERPKGAWRTLYGTLKGESNDAQLSVEDINTAIAEGGSAAGASVLDER